MIPLRPYIIVPVLIEQPTWGGDYITHHKKIRSVIGQDRLIGQSFELFQSSPLTSQYKSNHHPVVAVADPKDPTELEYISGDEQSVFSIQALIDQDPQAVLGSRAGTGRQITTLVKFNQAKGNSYQLHVKQPINEWLPKPESWYFLEPGLITLGVKLNADWSEYERICRVVDAKARDLSHQVQAGTLIVQTAREELTEFIRANDPQDFVNLLQVGKGQCVDLSACGIHHSWEENPLTHPQGNVVYEVQQNVYDPQATIRAFDKGKIKEDGSIRQLHIDDYFKHIDRSQRANSPASHYTQARLVKKNSTYTVTKLFQTDYYELSRVVINQAIENQHTQTTDSFHHLFVQSGSVELETRQDCLTLTQGFSAFVPANTGRYRLKPIKATHTAILKTELGISS